MNGVVRQLRFRGDELCLEEEDEQRGQTGERERERERARVGQTYGRLKGQTKENQSSDAL